VAAAGYGAGVVAGNGGALVETANQPSVTFTFANMGTPVIAAE